MLAAVPALVAPAPAATASEVVSAHARDTYQVQPGDTLWHIAIRELGSGRRWTEIYAMNRQLLAGFGGGPEALQPGMLLELPRPVRHRQGAMATPESGTLTRREFAASIEAIVRQVALLTHDGGLTDHMADVIPAGFATDAPVSRYEMAVVVHRLLALGEARGLLSPPPPGGELAFRDLPGDSPERPLVLEDGAFGLIAGFPDGTFRGDSLLTRHQYADLQRRFYGRIRALAQHTAAARNTPWFRFPSLHWPFPFTPMQAAAPAAFGFGLGNQVPGTLPEMTPALSLRLVTYPEGGFVLARTHIASLAPTQGQGGTLADEDFQGFWRFPQLGPLQIQPHLGARAMLGDGSLSLGPSVGLLAHFALGPIGLFGDVDEAAMGVGQGFSWQHGPSGTFAALFSEEGGVSYQLRRGLGIEVGYDRWDAPLTNATVPLAGLVLGVRSQF